MFGGRNKKERLYKHLDKARVLQLQSLGVKLVIDIGPPGAAPDQIGDIAVQERGIATVDEIGSLFKQARAGLLSYPADYLTKSGIWSSYIAHGVLPLVLSEAKPTAVIQEDEHFIRLKENRKRIPRNEAARVANNARFWYEEQASSQVAARTFLQIIQSVAR
ncbi:hypothetical protein CRI94_13970 [Longibacter salinarum]|uniref:Glycosyl transferase family 1 domain-containing protein n=1 Tax=Longibacter salinarum TaxID=1850348 RepID=A0A2A8CW46_9BACT|nr:hypothetical protein CRI94_13970 [Longibacter salinarum]